MDAAIIRRVLANPDQELVPFELVKRIAGGEHPVRVWRDYRGMKAGELAAKLLNLIYERGCQEKHLPDGLQPRHSIVVEAASPIFRSVRNPPAIQERAVQHRDNSRKLNSKFGTANADHRSI